MSCQRTCVFMVFRIRCLEEDLDAVERGNDCLCLEDVRSVGQVGNPEKGCVHTTQPATPPAMLERITWSADRNLDASELIRVEPHTQWAVYNADCECKSIPSLKFCLCWPSGLRRSRVNSKLRPGAPP